MSKTSIHVRPDLDGAVIATLEEDGFEVEPGNGPMVNYIIKGHSSENE